MEKYGLVVMVSGENGDIIFLMSPAVPATAAKAVASKQLSQVRLLKDIMKASREKRSG